MKYIGHNIRKIRTDLRISQLELAERANVSKTHLCLVEAGKKEPSLGLLTRIAVELNVDPSLLLIKDERYFSIQRVFSNHDLPSLKMLISSIISDIEQIPPDSETVKLKKSLIG